MYRAKLARFIEAIKDPKTWLFFLHAWSQEMANGMTNQYSLIINSFGFTVLQTTLLGTVSGAVSFFSLGIAAIVLYHTKVGNLSHRILEFYVKLAELSRMDLTRGVHSSDLVQHSFTR